MTDDGDSAASEVRWADPSAGRILFSGGGAFVPPDLQIQNSEGHVLPDPGTMGRVPRGILLDPWTKD